MAIFDTTSLEVSNGTFSDETDINDLVARLDTSLNTTVEGRLGVVEEGLAVASSWAIEDVGSLVTDNTTGVTLEGYSSRAYSIEGSQWATNNQGALVVGADGITTSEYSAKAYALEAAAYASGTGGVSTTADGVTTISYSANEKAIEAAASEAAAALSESNAAQSVLDAQDEVVNCQAQVTLAEAARDKAEKWSEEAEDVEVEPGKYSAYHWSQKAYDIVAAGAVIEVTGSYPITVDNTVQAEPIVSLDSSYIKKFGGY